MEFCHRLDPDCKACGKPVYWKKRLFYLDRLWHLDCFKCARCRVQLNTDAEENDARHSKAYLGEDFALRCDRCNEMFEQKKRVKVAFTRSRLISRVEGDLVECKRNRRATERHHCEHHYQANELSYLNIENEADLKKLIAKRHKCHCVGHRCVKEAGGGLREEQRSSNDERRSLKEQKRTSKDKHKRFSMNDKTNAKDEQMFLVEPKREADHRKCSSDKRKSFDRKCSFGERKYLNDNQDHLNVINDGHHLKGLNKNNQQNRTAEADADLQIYRSLFSNKSLTHKSAGQPTNERRTECNCRGCTDYMLSQKT